MIEGILIGLKTALTFQNIFEYTTSEIDDKYMFSIKQEIINDGITDIEVLRLHYAITLSKWYQNVVKNKQKIMKMYDGRFFKMWEFYLLISKYSFINMGNVVFQIQISKNINNLPITRNYIYN